MQLMQRVDVNGDGVIDVEEFKRVQSLKLHLLAQELLQQQKLVSPKVPGATQGPAAADWGPPRTPVCKSHSQGWMRRTGSWQ